MYIACSAPVDALLKFIITESRGDDARDVPKSRKKDDARLPTNVVRWYNILWLLIEYFENNLNEYSRFNVELQK